MSDATIALLAGNTLMSQLYNGPSVALAAIFLGKRNSGSFSSKPKMSSTTTLPGDFCLNIPITRQCY